MRPISWLVIALLCLLQGSALAQTAPSDDAAAGAADTRPAGQGDAIDIELNKLEDAEKNACRLYFVVDNGTPDPLKQLEIDVFLFDKEGVILRRAALSFPDVRPGRTKVVLFELADLVCGDVGRLLVNEVLTCTSADDKPIEGCADHVAVRSRGGAKFEY